MCGFAEGVGAAGGRFVPLAVGDSALRSGKLLERLGVAGFKLTEVGVCGVAGVGMGVEGTGVVGWAAAEANAAAMA